MRVVLPHFALSDRRHVDHWVFVATYIPSYSALGSVSTFRRVNIKRFRLAALALLSITLPLAASATSPSTTTSPVLSTSRALNFHEPLANEITVRKSSDGQISATTPRSSGRDEFAPPLSYNGGPVMGTTPAGTTIYPLYWAPSGYAFQSEFQGEMDTFLQDVALVSGSTTNSFGVASQYYQYVDGAFQYIQPMFKLGRELDDSDTYPLKGCTPDTGGDFTTCLTTAQVASELTAYSTSHDLPTGFATQYSIFFPPSVETCFTTRNASQGGDCSSGTKKVAYCGYHDIVGSGNSSLVYSVISSIAYCGTSWKPQPSGTAAAQFVATVVAHEIIESMTDPVYPTGWVDAKDQEVADLCQGDVVAQIFGNDGWEVQEIFSNADYLATPNSGGCASSLGAPLPTPVIPVMAILPIGSSPFSETVYEGIPFSLPLMATAGSGALAWSISSGSLPTGLTLSRAGVVSGTPTATISSLSIVEIVVMNSSGDASIPYKFAFHDVAQLRVSSTSPAKAFLGSRFTLRLRSRGGSGTILWSLPRGLHLSRAGTISGVPTRSGIFRVGVIARDSRETFSARETVSIQVMLRRT